MSEDFRRRLDDVIDTLFAVMFRVAALVIVAALLCRLVLWIVL